MIVMVGLALVVIPAADPGRWIRPAWLRALLGLVGAGLVYLAVVLLAAAVIVAATVGPEGVPS